MRRVTPAFVLLFLSPAICGAGLWDLIRSHRELEVITVTEVSTESGFRPAASRDQPHYYVAASLGYRDLGGQIAGFKQPPTELVLRLISAELAKQGYLPSTSRSGPPTLLLCYTWGTLNAERFYGPDPSRPPLQVNRGQIVRFLGGHKIGLDQAFFNPLTAPMVGLTANSYDARNLLEVAEEDFYVIVVSAYDLDAALEMRRKPPLWTTRIAAPSLGFSLADVMPAMLAIGGQQFGRETPRPVWINADDKFTPNVKLGELQLVEYLKSDPLPVTDASETKVEKKP
ncbi:hypothetical protein ESB00_00655 [Oleiharenicola lentus]|uniref:Uncharacterized protein n=1 Tax=Oleiharenicola lentus TaxID=2508720 RepID=A0A4Q1C6S8_9BACT|nr:hypothetical protein [Oleiharenicola lentus]RXK54442.1 hypothetical protein ESB00_00655 [Oleiharenicola lentus]